MPEATSALPPPLGAAPKPKPWVIVIAVIVVLCCFCIGAIGLLFAFGEPILKGLGLLNALLPTLNI